MSKITEQLIPAEAAGLTPLNDTLRMEAAMCLWEAIDGQPFAEQYRQQVGAAQLRHDVMEFVEAVHVGWHCHELATQAADVYTLCPFDWEFVPWFVQNCVDWETCTLDADWLKSCRTVGIDL